MENRRGKTGTSQDDDDRSFMEALQCTEATDENYEATVSIFKEEIRTRKNADEEPHRKKIRLVQDEDHAGRGTERGPTYKRNMSFMETIDRADAAKRAKAAQEVTEISFTEALQFMEMADEEDADTVSAFKAEIRKTKALMMKTR